MLCVVSFEPNCDKGHFGNKVIKDCQIAVSNWFSQSELMLLSNVRKFVEIDKECSWGMVGHLGASVRVQH